MKPATRRRRRTLLTLSLFILAGAIINVAVAWGCAALGSIDPNVFSSVPPKLDAHHWEFLDRAGWDWPRDRDMGRILYPAIITEGRTFGLSGIEYGIVRNGDGDNWGNWEIGDQVSAGWPLECLHGGRIVPTVFQPGKPRQIDSIALNGFGGVFFNSNTRDLPLQPNLPSFAINSILYAAVLWIMSASVLRLSRAVRRWRRTKRGLCPACAYPVGTWGGNVCTECGAPRHPPVRIQKP